MLPSYPLILASQSADGAALSNVTISTNILHGSGIATIPAGALQIGSTIKMLLRGRISTVVTTPGTLTFEMRLGSVIISALGALPLNVTAQTNASWELELMATIRSIGNGVSANAIVTGRFTSRALVGSVATASGGNGLMIVPDTAPVVGTGFDATAAQSVNVFAVWSVASASNSILVHQSITELKV